MTNGPERLFDSAVDHYARYRTRYPTREVDRLAERVGLDRTKTVIDVGCGTGQLALPLARHAGSVIAIDPVSEMLTVGRRDAEAGGLDNITWVHGGSSELATLVEPGAHVATFAASFHWTDRAEVVRALDRLLDGTGSIVTINDILDDEEDPPWAQAVADLRNRYLGPHHTAATDPYTKAPVSHHSILTDSPFSAVEQRVWTWERTLTVDEAVGLQFTYSFSSPARFGDRADDFAADARAAILALHPDGHVTEPFRMEVLIATRP